MAGIRSFLHNVFLTEVPLPTEVTVTEATQERRLVSNLKDLLNLLKVERALAHIVLWIERIVNARTLSRHEALIDLWSTSVEVVRLRVVSWLPAHDGCSMVNFSIVV